MSRFGLAAITGAARLTPVLHTPLRQRKQHTGVHVRDGRRYHHGFDRHARLQGRGIALEMTLPRILHVNLGERSSLRALVNRPVMGLVDKRVPGAYTAR